MSASFLEVLMQTMLLCKHIYHINDKLKTKNITPSEHF